MLGFCTQYGEFKTVKSGLNQDFDLLGFWQLPQTP
jgi:hypothetical protein